MNTNETWEERIDQELYFLSQDGYAAGWREMKVNDIKTIVRETISKERREMEEAIETFKKPRLSGDPNRFNENESVVEWHNAGYNEALKDVLALYKNKDK